MRRLNIKEQETLKRCRAKSSGYIPRARCNNKIKLLGLVPIRGLKGCIKIRIFLYQNLLS